MNIPSGVRFLPNFITSMEQQALVQQSLSLYNSISRDAQGLEGREVKTYLSKQHNLPTMEHYKLVRIQDNWRHIHAGHFEKYGEEGHTLTYFIGNENIPGFVLTGIISKMEKLDVVQKIKPVQQLVWKFTFNTYRSNKNTLAGFDFHKDIPENGTITAILTLMSEAVLEMKHPEKQKPSYAATLIPGSLFVLSGEARWDWQHRVIPKPLDVRKDDIQRISLVLGCQ